MYICQRLNINYSHNHNILSYYILEKVKSINPTYKTIQPISKEQWTNNSRHKKPMFTGSLSPMAVCIS
jgi:hypothetical protein